MSWSKALGDPVALSVAIEKWRTISAYARIPIKELVNRGIERLTKYRAGIGHNFQSWGIIKNEWEAAPTSTTAMSLNARETPSNL